VQETTTPSNTFNDELDDVARGVLQGLDLADLQQASTEEEVAIVSGDSQQINDVPLDHQFLTLDFQVSWDVELDLPINAGVASDSNDGQQHIPAASIWSRRPHSIQGDINIPAVICGLYGEGVVVQARRIRGFLHPYRSDGRIHKSFAERRRRIAGFDVSQAARAAGRADIDTDEKTIKRKKKPSDNDTNNLGVPDGIVGNVIADVRLGEAFEPPHAVDDVANFKTDAVVDQKSPKDPKGINVNAKSHLRAEQSPKSRGEDTSVSSATDPLVFPAVAPVLIAMPLLVAPVIIPPVEIPHEEPLAIPGAWPDPVPIHAPPGRAPRRPLWDIFADWFDDTWEALFEPVVE
jgi:hypothetical protein